MRARTCMLVTGILMLGTAFGTAGLAADPQQSFPKEGTWKGQYTSYGANKAVEVGKERVLVTFDEHGTTLGDGIFNEVIWHCWGQGDFTNGVGQEHGYCVGTEPGGDQVAIDFTNDKHSMDKPPKGSFCRSPCRKPTGTAGRRLRPRSRRFCPPLPSRLRRQSARFSMKKNTGRFFQGCGSSWNGTS